MLSLKTILAPVDFSQRTEAEAQSAADIARHFGSRLILLHVIPPFAEAQPANSAAANAYSREFSSEVEKGVHQALQSLAARLSNDVAVECAVLSGGPAEKIKEFTKDREIDLVVMPTAGGGRVGRQLFGSVTTHMLQDLACPMLTGLTALEIKPDKRPPYQKIACKVEPGEKAAAQRLRWARDFAAAYRGSLYVVGVLPFVDTVGSTPPLPEHLQEKALNEAVAQLQALCAEQGTHAEITALGGPVDEVLAPFIAANEIDLLVSDHRRRQDTMGLFGLHTDVIDTVQSVPCPVVLL